MRWMVVDVASGVAGLAVLAALGLRVARQTGRLVRELRRASHGIRAAEEQLAQVVEAQGRRARVRS